MDLSSEAAANPAPLVPHSYGFEDSYSGAASMGYDWFERLLLTSPPNSSLASVTMPAEYWDITSRDRQLSAFGDFISVRIFTTRLEAVLSASAAHEVVARVRGIPVYVS